jgi:hypothetical protein
MTSQSLFKVLVLQSSQLASALHCRMVRNLSRASKGLRCLGVLRTGERCRRARDGSGVPVVLNKKCEYCKEQRCRKHCKCERNKSDRSKGRSGPRGASETSNVRVVVASVAPAAPVAQLPSPRGPPLNLSCVMLDVDTYYSRCRDDIATASEVELASYMYDNLSLHKLLLKRLRGQTQFSVRVYLDAEMFGGTVPRFQRPRARELFNAGAKVFLCKGPRAQGSFHCKGIVVDRRYLYSGSPNATDKSEKNEEFCFRITGPPVSQVLQRLTAQLEKGKQWDGS